MRKGCAEDAMMVLAHSVWRRTYGAGGAEADAMALVSEHIKHLSAEVPDYERVRATDLARLVFAVQWLHSACMTLTTSHKFAAALCASTVRGADVFDDIILPSKTFRVLVPDGIFANERYNLEFTQINVCSLENGQATIALEGLGDLSGTNPSDPHERRLAVLPVFYSASDGENALMKLLAHDMDDDEVVWVIAKGAEEQQSVGEREVRVRMLRLARRLVTGLLLTFTHTTNWSDRSVGARASHRDGRNPPPHRNIFIGRPIDMDARPSVAAYIGAPRGKLAPPSVQSMVRGHHKRQVIGVARSGRRVIWIEPYWRGPEDAPILARPYMVGAP